MKTFRSVSIAIIGFLSFSLSLFAAGPVVGTIEPVSDERITVLVGDKAALNIGQNDGIIRGDVGFVGPDRVAVSDRMIGQCAVTTVADRSSACEVIKANREIEKGDFIFFDPVAFTDATLYPFIIDTLANIVEPYEPYRRLRVCVYGMFNSENATTGLSEEMEKEFRKVFSQKGRIQLVTKDAMKKVVFYPDAFPQLIDFVKGQMKGNDIDVLIIGKHSLTDDKIEVSILKLDRNGHDRTITFPLPLENRYMALNSKVILTAREPSKGENVTCRVVVKAVPHLLNKDEKNQVVKSESGGNPLLEQSLKRLDFNVVNPVEIKVRVDDESLAPPTKGGQTLKISTGEHSIAVSFRRAYFFNETLLYTSDQEVTKQATLDLTKENGLVIEIGINPYSQKDAIVLSMYHPLQRQRQVLRPIRTIESEKTIDSFKD